jgi:HSP20 family protein
MSLLKRDRSTWPGELAWPPEERVDRAFQDMFRNFFTGGALLSRFSDGLAGSLHVEEFMDAGTGVIRIEMPGLDPEKDVEISIVDGHLNVEAHREERKEEDKPDGYRSEFRYGSFRRSIRLPEGTSEADVKASYKDGILEVRVPAAVVTPQPTAKKIPIERA